MIDGTPYEGIPFLWGVDDCYGMLCRVYEQEFGIKLTKFARPTNWQSGVLDIITNAFPHDGWVKVLDWKPQDLRPGDVLAIAVNDSNPNHLGVYLGDNKFLHHFYAHLSRVDPMGRHWLHHTCFLLRHPDVPDLRPQLPDVSIQELLRARYPKSSS